MYLNEMVDKIVRKSFFGVRLSQFRATNPRLYKQLRSSYERILSLRSRSGLARYQARAVRRFLRSTSRSLLSSTVLEIGSDLDAKVVKALRSSGCRSVIGINPKFDDHRLADINARLPDGCSLRKDDIRSPGFPDRSIGAIFSVGVFEHLLDFELCLSEMHRILRPGGCVYAEFGPIWSSSLGHHVNAVVEGEESKHSDPTKNPVPNYGHLLMSRSEMADYLKGRVSDALRGEIIAWIYDKPNINRLFLEDYLRLMRNSKLELVQTGFDREHAPPDILGRLRNKYPGFQIFDVRNLQVVLRKPTSG